ncbi:MAG: CRISPR-associated endonuclease Cas1 [Zetaproteobacteria bacterium CG_4_9_14_3_um_filter_49_83]|nr:MAG: CRISPR-associated endonuclease Cas1 [Zetaproteobacteria bacterium CG17_big_fil_post_rev_8_21_14_2_50_50_13]PJA35502.1 MAG: CRISPR-associated endonuclease Cas1 [Zetaproteobacteria bacterium CG_4_9_14_3_um_filter_49_83]
MAVEPWLESLLPIRAITFEMRFTEACTPGFFHQAALTAWIRRMLGSPQDYSQWLTLDAAEQGKRHYRAGELYRFTLFAIGDTGHEWMIRLLSGLASGTSSLHWDRPMPFRNNWQLERLLSFPDAEEIRASDPVAEFNRHALSGELAWLRAQPCINLRFISPWRVLRNKGEQKPLRGELRYCRNSAHLHANDALPLWIMRIGDAMRDLARQRGCQDIPQRGETGSVHAVADLFWVDASYQDVDGNRKPMGGLLGQISAIDPQQLDDQQLSMLILGQYLGVGQRRAFGYGRYQLLDAQGKARLQRSAAVGLLEDAMREENLASAWEVVSQPQCDDDAPDLPEDNDDDHAQLLPMAEKLLHGQYQPPPLIGFVHEDADGGLRPLAAPPLHDRALQRAVHQILSPRLDNLMDQGSYGFRAGRSRYQVRDLIQRLHREGYRWVFESDIRSFFDSVTWPRLEERLRSLFGDDPAVDAILAWMKLPVRFEGKRIVRQQGLPQGSPLSPVLANLMLDDFDQDLTDAGCRLIRFADDFVIVAKTREAAEHGGHLARHALVDAGLQLNEDKTRIVPFSEGFRFLGFVFVDGMAVESKPQRSADAGKPPPQSWLAQAMLATGETAQETPQETQLRGEAPVHLAPWQEQMRLLIFCGEPALVFSRAGRLCIERDDERLHEVPWEHLDAVVLFGRHQVTTPAMHEALSHGVPVHMATGGGKYLGVVSTAKNGADASELWLRQQQCFNDEAWALAAAKTVVESRIRHMGEMLRRRQTVDESMWKPVFDNAIRKLTEVANRESLNGIEGHASKTFFSVLKQLVPEVYGFDGRKRRPPTDPFNALLSFGYTLLYAHVDSLLRVDGLLPVKGFYHQSHGAHAALASDLMEPFRHIVEREALKMLQGHRLNPDDFQIDADAGCIMSAPARRLYCAAIAEALLAPLTERGGKEACSILEHIHQQNLALRVAIHGKSHGFHAWRMR